MDTEKGMLIAFYDGKLSRDETEIALGRLKKIDKKEPQHWPGRFNPEQDEKFFDEKQSAYLDIVGRLEELNEGWRPDYSDSTQVTYSAVYNYKVELVFVEGRMDVSVVRDELLAKTKEIWEQVIEEFGKEKIILGLWGRHEEKDS